MCNISIENVMQGFAVICDCSGRILQNLAVGANMPELAEGEDFLCVISNSSRECWSALCDRRSSPESTAWRLLFVTVCGEEYPCIAAQIPGDRVLLVGVQGERAFVSLYEEMVCITTQLTNRVRRLHKKLAQGEASLIAEMWQINNDLTNTRRELFKKNRELENANRLLEEIAVTDQLTKLCNRGSFPVRLPELIARTRRSQSPLCIAILDINGFKQVNDTYGHHVGDMLLKRLADCLRSETRLGQDTCYRVGGDEFMVTLEGCDDKAGRAILERVHAKYASDAYGTTLAIGIVAVDVADLGDNLEQYIRIADHRMYECKAKQKANGGK